VRRGRRKGQGGGLLGFEGLMKRAAHGVTLGTMERGEGTGAARRRRKRIFWIWANSFQKNRKGKAGKWDRSEPRRGGNIRGHEAERSEGVGGRLRLLTLPLLVFSQLTR